MSEVIITPDPPATVLVSSGTAQQITVGDPTTSPPQRVVIVEAAYTGAIDDSNTSFDTQTFVEETLEVYYEGVRQKRGIHFQEKAGLDGFDLLFTPITGSNLLINLTIIQ